MINAETRLPFLSALPNLRERAATPHGQEGAVRRGRVSRGRLVCNLCSAASKPHGGSQLGEARSTELDPLPALYSAALLQLRNELKGVRLTRRGEAHASLADTDTAWRHHCDRARAAACGGSRPRDLHRRQGLAVIGAVLMPRLHQQIRFRWLLVPSDQCARKREVPIRFFCAVCSKQMRGRRAMRWEGPVTMSVWKLNRTEEGVTLKEHQA